MNTMSDLPNTNQPTIPFLVGSMAKEAAPIVENSESPIITEVGQEVDLSSEVKKAGVTMQSDTIELPKPIQNLGVTQVGVAAPVKKVSYTPPLTDDQIALGLKQSLSQSLRWLSEWCKRQAQIVLRRVYAN